MRHLPDSPAWIAVALAAALALMQTVRLWWRRFAPARRLRLRAARARVAEARAPSLLSAHGYSVTDEQPVARWRIGAHEALVRADFLVTRNGRRYVAEVKSGAEAPSLSSRSTRRQLLEYLCAFAVDGVLLVDPEAERVELIDFRLPSRVRRWPTAVVAFMLGALTTAALWSWYHPGL